MLYCFIQCIFQSEMRKQELLAQLAAEEQRGHELTKIVKELLPTPKKNMNSERQPRYRRVSFLHCIATSSFVIENLRIQTLCIYIPEKQ